MQKNGEIIGGAILFEEERKLYVGRIFINPQHFGQGYGIQLMRDIECCFPDVYVIQLDGILTSTTMRGLFNGIFPKKK